MSIRNFTLLLLAFVGALFAAPDTVAPKKDTVYVQLDDGIPWDRSHFNPERLLRHDSFDPSLSVAYTYSLSFISTPRGSLGQTSYLAHLAYEFSPNFHMYADVGLWMPLFSTFSHHHRFEREDIRQGKVDFVLPAIAFVYQPTEKFRISLSIVNEDDARKAYGPFYYRHSYWRNSIFWP